MFERLTAIDANFWSLDTETTHQAIASFCPLDGMPDVQIVKRRYSQLVEHFPRLGQKIVGEKRFCWVKDDSFDIKNHVKLVYVPEMLNERDLHVQAAQVFSRGLERDRPPWALVIISNKLEPTKKHLGERAPIAGVMILLHHALADGLGGLEILHRICSKSREESLLTSLPLVDPITLSAVATNQINQSNTAPLFSTSRNLFRIIRESLEPKAQSVFNGPNSSERSLSFFEFPLGELGNIRKKLGSSINDLFLTLVTGATRRYQEAYGKIVTDMKVIMPVSLRNYKLFNFLGNHLTGVGVKLPVTIADPLAQLAVLKEGLAKIKNDGSIGAYSLLAKINSNLPPQLRLEICEAAARRTNFICTNMRGPDEPLYIAGARIEGEYGCAALMRKHGIAFSLISYANKACIALVSDPEILPNPPELLHYFAQAKTELVERVS